MNRKTPVVSSISVVAALVTASAWFCSAHAASRWTMYRNKKYGFQFVLLKDWKISEARTHPSILMAAFHPSGAEVRLSASVLSTRVTLLSFARNELEALKKIGLHVGSPIPFQAGGLKGLWARGVHPTKPYSFRVYFFSRKRAYFVFTFTYPTKKYREVMHALRIILLTFRFIE